MTAKLHRMEQQQAEGVAVQDVKKYMSAFVDFGGKAEYIQFLERELEQEKWVLIIVCMFDQNRCGDLYLPLLVVVVQNVRDSAIPSLHNIVETSFFHAAW